MTLLQLFLIVVGLAVVATLVRRAPDSWIAEPFKTWLVYILVVVAAVVILQFFGVWQAIAGFHF